MNPFPPKHRQRLGKYGEELAVRYLQKHGYRILERNFKARYGELDIICVKDNVLVFVEVKTRIGEKFGKPEESVTSHKLRELIKTAEYYLVLHPNFRGNIRIDLVAIQLSKGNVLLDMKHIKNITM